MWQYFANKDWSVYPFLAPALSIFLSITLVPLYDRLFGARLKKFLQDEGQYDENRFQFVNAVAKDRGLQIAYLTGSMSFLSSLIATLKSDHSDTLTVLVLPFFFVWLVLFLFVFMREPGYLSMMTCEWPACLKKRQWKQVKLYSHILMAFNFILIIFIVFAMPERK